VPAIQQGHAPRPGGELVVLGSEHLEPCLALDQRCLNGLWTAKQWEQELKAADRPCLGLQVGEELVGIACGWLVVDELHITAIAVDPNHRRLGLGRLLLLGLLQEGLQRGAAQATLEVSSSNQAARRLYEGCGFRTSGCRRGYYRNGDDALIQWMCFRDSEGVRIAALF
jgi:ribosomal-protein-alanine N-acetyltransferase